MEIKEIPPTFKTSDGQEFTDKAEAIRHQEFVTAKDAFIKARQTFAYQLALRQRTRDDQPFKWEAWQYWYISDNWCEMPELREVSFYFWNVTFAGDDGNEFAIEKQLNGKTYTYKIQDLYAIKANAEKALLEAMKGRLEFYSKSVNEFEQKLR